MADLVAEEVTGDGEPPRQFAAVPMRVKTEQGSKRRGSKCTARALKWPPEPGESGPSTAALGGASRPRAITLHPRRPHRGLAPPSSLRGTPAGPEAGRARSGPGMPSRSRAACAELGPFGDALEVLG